MRILLLLFYFIFLTYTEKEHSCLIITKSWKNTPINFPKGPWDTESKFNCLWTMNSSCLSGKKYECFWIAARSLNITWMYKKTWIEHHVLSRSEGGRPLCFYLSHPVSMNFPTDVSDIWRKYSTLKPYIREIFHFGQLLPCPERHQEKIIISFHLKELMPYLYQAGITNCQLNASCYLNWYLDFCKHLPQGLTHRI